MSWFQWVSIAIFALMVLALWDIASAIKRLVIELVRVNNQFTEFYEKFLAAHDLEDSA